MKPVKLTIEGINSFIEPQTLDFGEVGRNNLFCISGKTGAGKSTIFDSLMIALYGKSGRGNISDVVNLSRMTAKITLDFAEGNDLYTVERNIKCRQEKGADGNPTDKRAAVTDVTLFKNGVPCAKGEQANAAVMDIVGLDPAEFKNVYLLEQGEYAEFLKKTPQKQVEVVGKIFSLMRFAEVTKLANERVREYEQAARSQEQFIARLGDVSPEKLAALKKEAATVKAKATVLGKDAKKRKAELAELSKARDVFLSVRQKQDNVRSLQLRSDDEDKRVYAAQCALERFERTVDPAEAQAVAALNKQLNELSALNALDREYAKAVKDCELKRAEASGKAQKLESCESKYAELENASQAQKRGFLDRIAECKAQAAGMTDRPDDVRAALNALDAPTGLIAAVTDALYALNGKLKEYNALVAEKARKDGETADADAACARLLAVIQKLTDELALREAALRNAENKRDAAQADLSAAQLYSHAAAVRAELHDGDACPVCGGTFTAGTRHGDGDVQACKAAYDQACAEVKAAADEKAECEKSITRSKLDYEQKAQAAQKLKELSRALSEQAQNMHVYPEAYAAMLKSLKEAKDEGERAQQFEEKRALFRPELERAKAECEGAKTALADAEQKAQSIKSQLGDDCGKTDERIARVKSDLSAAEAALKKTEDRRKALSDELERAKAASDAIKASLAAAKADCPVDIPAFDEEDYELKREAAERIAEEISELERQVAVMENDIARAERDCAELEKAGAELRAITKSIDTYRRIAEITKGKALLDFVAAEYIAEFTAVASGILNELSGGKYTMEYDRGNGFIVADFLNGGKRRKTDTLSGGELFLASLSVAIAIARTQSKGNNAFFFLDEGFGTLDDELIETVYGALEMLSADCLVGVITHAAALIDRMPSCVTVYQATDTSGSIIDCR